MRRYRCSNAIVGGALIAAAAMLLPAMLHAQEGSPEVSPPPGTSWGSPLFNAIGSQQTEETLRKAVHKPLRKMRRITPMHRF